MQYADWQSMAIVSYKQAIKQAPAHPPRPGHRVPVPLRQGGSGRGRGETVMVPFPSLLPKLISGENRQYGQK